MTQLGAAFPDSYFGWVRRIQKDLSCPVIIVGVLEPNLTPGWLRITESRPANRAVTGGKNGERVKTRLEFKELESFEMLMKLFQGIFKQACVRICCVQRSANLVVDV